MKTIQEMKKALDFIQKNCKADDFTFYVSNKEDLLTRFAQNGITQHINGENLNIRLSVAFDNKNGSASVNHLDEDALKYLIKTAENIAKLNQPDPEFVASEDAHNLPEVNNYSKRTASLSVEEIVDDLKLCVDNAKKLDAKVSGISEKKVFRNLLATKNGFIADEDMTTFSHSMTMKKGGVETKVSHSVKDRDKFDMNTLIDKLNGQFNALKDPVALEKGRIPVILRPAAVLRWMFYLVWTFDRREADEGTTPFTNQMGKQFFGKDFNFHSSLLDKDLYSPKYILDGIPSENMSWIKNGVIENMRLSRYYAKKLSKKAKYPYNIIIDGGNASEQEMMKKVGRGVIVNNFWYIRPIDRKSGEWTGLTRDGVLYFEDGKIVKSINNFRWNEVLHEATRRILALGKSEQLEYYAKVPAMLIDDFNFVDVTTF